MISSADGTRLAVTREGAGPAVVLVGGGLDPHAPPGFFGTAADEIATAVPNATRAVSPVKLNTPTRRPFVISGLPLSR